MYLFSAYFYSESQIEVKSVKAGPTLCHCASNSLGLGECRKTKFSKVSKIFRFFIGNFVIFRLTDAKYNTSCKIRTYNTPVGEWICSGISNGCISSKTIGVVLKGRLYSYHPKIRLELKWVHW